VDGETEQRDDLGGPAGHLGGRFVQPAGDGDLREKDKVWARAWPSAAVAPCRRAARTPSWAAASATWLAWYQRANWTTTVISNSTSGMTSTVSSVPAPA